MNATHGGCGGQWIGRRGAIVCDKCGEVLHPGPGQGATQAP